MATASVDAATQRKYENLRSKLAAMHYYQPLSLECMPLVEKLFSDLVLTTDSYR